ncbi:UMP-CMP kinase 2, mitochondrial [Bombina bombina]|uniref:UMP-CMP kinase 2, mitochondrial n=1 Tax=Bombina bombina TaxID=8345 RepID=UPI00235AFD37|nr:UMP-CMP kinase 2, mitochondrial [Bombina bombina]
MPVWSMCRPAPCLQIFLKRKIECKSCTIMANSLNSCSADWKRRVFAVDSNPSLGYTNPFYFTSFDNKHHGISMSPVCEWEMLKQGAIGYSLCVTDSHRTSAARLHKLLGHHLVRDLKTNCTILRLLSYLPHDPYGSLEKGFMLIDPMSSLQVEDRLRNLLTAYKQNIRFCSYQQNPGGYVLQKLWTLNGKATEIGSSHIVKLEKPAISPFVVNIKNSAVFYSLDHACAVFKECLSIFPEARNLLELIEREPYVPKKGEFPVIVIEGLDATGKSTLTQSLKVSLKAALLKSPPDCISQWRKTFDDEPSLIRRAYYALGNYIVESQIAEASKHSPVIVDRYWHSTAAYAIATEIGGSAHNLPESHHEVYQWPNDLLKPDLVILLTVRDEERIKRIQGRGLAETKEEKELETNSMFRQKVEETYKRMENPGCVIIDASASKQSVLTEALFIIKKYFDV